MLHVPLALWLNSCLNDVDVVWGSKGSHGKNSFHCEAIMEDRRADVKLQNVDSPTSRQKPSQNSRVYIRRAIMFMTKSGTTINEFRRKKRYKKCC